MKVLHLSTWQTGGAAIATTRLSTQLNHLGINSHILNMSSKLPAYIDAAIGKLTLNINPIFHSYNYFGENIMGKVVQFKPDLIHVHWVGAGFITPESLAQLGLPVIWTLHDLWPLCGAEHLPGSNRFEVGYTKDNRPSKESGLDLDRFVWQRKMRAFKNMNITFVAQSRYVYNMAKSAKILGGHKLVHIPNGVNTNIFKPIPKVPGKKPTILYVAMNPDLDPNKGYADFKQAISDLPTSLRAKIRIKIITGQVTGDNKMTRIYQGADITVVPSKMETLSFVTMESLACGTPVVAYNVGGIPDLVEHGKNGYLAKPYDVKDLSRGIEKILTSPRTQKEYGRYGREKIAKSFNLSAVTKKYLKLYESLI